MSQVKTYFWKDKKSFQKMHLKRNCFREFITCKAYLNGIAIAAAPPNVLSTVIEFDFTHNSNLEIQEPFAILQLNSLEIIKCYECK